MKKVIKHAFIKSLPVMAGYIVLGVGFGILLKTAGYGLFWSFFMSLTIYAGSMQYVAVSLLTSGASLISVALTTLMVNARHLFFGAYSKWLPELISVIGVVVLHVWKRNTLLSIIGGTICYMMLIRFMI